jgi:hypothetical protein
MAIMPCNHDDGVGRCHRNSLSSKRKTIGQVNSDRSQDNCYAPTYDEPTADVARTLWPGEHDL